MAGDSLTPEDHSGAALFWIDPGWCTRLYIRSPAKDAYVVASAERTLASCRGADTVASHGTPRPHSAQRPSPHRRAIAGS
jgi:hypothetical protein